MFAPSAIITELFMLKMERLFVQENKVLIFITPHKYQPDIPSVEILDLITDNGSLERVQSKKL